MKNAIKLFFTYFVLYFVSLALFILFIRTPLLKNMDVLMYRGTALLTLASLLSALLMMLFKKVCKISWIEVKDAILLFVGCVALNMVLFTLIPVTVERSVSVFTLSYVDELDDSFTKEEIEQVFWDKYVKEFGAFDKRFDEQLVTGSIKENEDGTYELTERGEKIVKLFRWVADVFGTDKRLVYPLEGN